MFIGKFADQNCIISPFAPNQCVNITGISGSGKTVRMQTMELEAVKAGDTVIVLDIGQTHIDQQIFVDIKKEFYGNLQRIDAVEDGLDFPIFTAQGTNEPFVSVVNSALTAFCSGTQVGARQAGALRGAIIDAIKNRPLFDNDAVALKASLSKNDDAASTSVYQKLWTVLNCGALRSGTVKIEPGKINIIDFSGYDIQTRKILAEIVLAVLWRWIQYAGMAREHSVLLVLDEVQNFSWNQNATLPNLMREGRKFGLKTVLATQTSRIFSADSRAMIDQAATHLYFRPAFNEVRTIAKKIDEEQFEKLEKALKSLNVGECIAIGEFQVGNRSVKRAIKLR